MVSDKLIIDSATGSSPPKTLTRDVGCSPIRFRSPTRSTVASRNDFDSSLILLNQEEDNIGENLPMKKYVLLFNISMVFFKFYCRMTDNKQTSSLSLASSCSSSIDTTPTLSSFSTTRPVSLMSLGNIIFSFTFISMLSSIIHFFLSLEVNDRFRFQTAQKSPSTNNYRRYWPVARKPRFQRPNQFRQRSRHMRSGGDSKQGADCCEQFNQIKSGKLAILTAVHD